MSQLVSPKSLGGLIVKRYEPSRTHYVYFLTLGGELQYVGKTNDIRKRIQQHTSRGLIRFDDVFFLECNEECIDDMERAMIMIYSPPKNATGTKITPHKRLMINGTELERAKMLMKALKLDNEQGTN